eukprot:15447086-Alexandrium_andersonii.AAC.1
MDWHEHLPARRKLLEAGRRGCRSFDVVRYYTAEHQQSRYSPPAAVSGASPHHAAAPLAETACGASTPQVSSTWRRSSDERPKPRRPAPGYRSPTYQSIVQTTTGPNNPLAKQNQRPEGHADEAARPTYLHRETAAYRAVQQSAVRHPCERRSGHLGGETPKL